LYNIKTPDLLRQKKNSVAANTGNARIPELKL